MTQTTHTYEIVIDAAARDDLIANTDSFERDAERDLAHYANAAHVRFANIHAVPYTDSHRASSADVAVRFDATPADVSRYAETFDLFDDDIELVD